MRLTRLEQHDPTLTQLCSWLRHGGLVDGWIGTVRFSLEELSRQIRSNSFTTVLGARWTLSRYGREYQASSTVNFYPLLRETIESQISRQLSRVPEILVDRLTLGMSLDITIGV